jgi:hypothetical protein
MLKRKDIFVFYPTIPQHYQIERASLLCAAILRAGLRPTGKGLRKLCTLGSTGLNDLDFPKLCPIMEIQSQHLICLQVTLQQNVALASRTRSHSGQAAAAQAGGTRVDSAVEHLEGRMQPCETLEGWLQLGEKPEGWVQPDGTLEGWVQPDGTLEGWLQPGGTLEGWVQPGGTLEGWVQPGGTLESWVQPGGTLEGWVQPGGTLEGWVQPGRTRGD